MLKTLAALAVAALTLAGCSTGADEATVTVTSTAPATSSETTSPTSSSTAPESSPEAEQPAGVEPATQPSQPALQGGAVTTEVTVTCEDGAVVDHWAECMFGHDTGDHYTPTIPEQIPDLPLYEPPAYVPPAYDPALEGIAGDSNVYAPGGAMYDPGY